MLATTFIIGCGQFYLYAQGSEFNNEIRLEDRSTTIRDISIYKDSLWISGGTGIDSTGFAGIFILKMDTLGNIDKVRYFHEPGPEDDLLQEGREPMLINRAGNILLTGEFFRFRDIYLIEVNRSFDTFLYRHYPYDYLTMFSENIIESDDSYYITGIVQTQNYDLDAFIQKVDKVGNKIWLKTYGVPSRDETGRSTVLENDGLTVMISESYDPSPTIKNDTRYWIRFMHIDTSGTIQSDWKEEVTGNEGWSGSLLKYGTDYIYTTNYLGEEYGFGYYQAAQIVRRDKDFNLIWRIPYGERDTYWNGFGDMIISADSNLLLTGQILDTSQTYELERVLKICPDGSVICETRDTGYIMTSGESLSLMEGIAESASGSIYAVGYSYRNTNFREGLLLKVNIDGCIDTLCTTVDIEEILKNHIEKSKVYPNPANDHITFDTKDISVERNLELYDFHGRLMLSQNLSPGINTIKIDKQVFLPGLYIWKMRDRRGEILDGGKIMVGEN